MTPVGLRLQELRRARGWTQAELAERAGLRRVTISNIERGATKGVDFETLERLATAFGVDAGYLIVQTPGKGKRPRT